VTSRDRLGAAGEHLGGAESVINADAAPLFRMEGVSKRYGGVCALEQAYLECVRGRIHAVLGENGAGKSTLIKVMAGAVQPDSGVMELEGRAITFPNPAAAMGAGIACIFQELSLIPDLTVADNIAITNPPTRLGLINRRYQRHLAEEALARAGATDIHPLSKVRDLPLSRRQMVEIAKALARNPKILILDEATSALTAADVERVFRMLKRLRSGGLAIVYISHRMHEIAEVADDCTVFRNGRFVATFAAGTKSDDAIVEMMIGREYKSVFPPKPPREPNGAPAFEVRNLSWSGHLKGINLAVRPGEVVGLGGLDGQGQRELLLALFGVLIGVSCTVEVGGKPVALRSPRSAKRREVGMALIPEDRKTEGLMLPMSVRDNLSFAAAERFSRFGLIDADAERVAIERVIRLLGIRSDGIEGPVGALSGGNQQKVVIGKWLMTNPRIILLNDPTRGIDVGTKQELYEHLRRLADEGAAIVFYSTDYDELIGCCDRVLVLYDGAIVRTLEGDAITERELVASALNLAGAAKQKSSTNPEVHAPVEQLSDHRGETSPSRGDTRTSRGGPTVAGRPSKSKGKRDWGFFLSEHRGVLFAAALFLMMFALYISKHPAGFSATVANTAANKGALLALVAMAQTLPVLTAGLDLSVGMVFVLSNCIASTVVTGSPLETAFGALVVLAVGLLCGAINGTVVVYGRLQPIIATLATGAIYYGCALWLRPVPGGTVNSAFADAMVGSLPGGIPTSLLLLSGVALLVWLPYQRSVVGRAAYAVGSSEPAAYMSGIPIARAKFLAYLLAGFLASLAGLLLTCITYSGEANAILGGGYTLNSIAAVVIGGTSLFGGSGGAIGSILGAFVLRTIGDLLLVFDLDPLWQPLFLGVVLLVAVSLGSLRLIRFKNKLDIYGGSERAIRALKRIDPVVLAVFGCIAALLFVGSFYSSNFLSPQYLLQQLQVASFLGIIAAGLMLVILLGHIDLSIPWVVTIGGMMSTAAAGWGGAGSTLAIPIGIASGLGIGLVNGIGVAYLRVPSMIFTLGTNAIVQGLMVVHTSGFAPQDRASATMHLLAVGRSVLGVPNTLWVWAIVGIFVVVLLTRTVFGRRVYAIGNCESAAYLSGVDTRGVIIACFVISGACSALSGVLLAGYSTKAYQAMGDPYLLPAIAAVVLGGTSILGGRGAFLGTIAGVILITMLQSILSVVQMPEAGRQIIYGSVIVAMLLLYGRERLQR
jgi:ribose transport system ATP-binding protein